MAQIYSRAVNIFRRHWHERGYYANLRSWLMSIYNRLMIHLPRVPLPGRRRRFLVHLKGVEKPLLVRLATTDWYALEEVFIRGEYDPLKTMATRQVRQILDVGANVGMSIRLWQTWWPEAKIVAVEPDGENLRMVQENAALGGGNSPQCFHAFAAARARAVHLDRKGGEYAFSMVEGEIAGESIDALTIPEICQRAGIDGAIDLLKCDIEGTEAEVFADCAGWISRVRYLVVELHAPYGVAQFREDLAKAGLNPRWHHVEDKGFLAVAFLDCQAPHS